MSNFRLSPFIPDEVPYRADGSVDRERLPQGMNLAMDDVTEWFMHCEATGTIRDVVEMTDIRRFTPQGELKAPKYVRFHFFDSGKRCDEIFWEDPHTFTPRRGRNGYVDFWGVHPHNEDGISCVDGLEISYRTMATLYIYRIQLPMKTPEIQFVDALMQKKVTQLKDLDLGDHPKRDYTLYVSLQHIEHPKDPKADRYWRRIRVSGGLPLGVFADKVLTPLWGWVRNLHAHAFHDFTDGAMFGPKDCNSVDMQHLDKSGHAYIAEEDYRIAHILREPGQVMGYQYDFGDNWWVDIKVEQIAPPAESTGAVTILAGAGGTPPDGEFTGTHSWAEYLQDAAKSPAGKRATLAVLFGATNYADTPPPPRPTAYDFDYFDIEAARARVRRALDSKASVPGASKKFVTPVAGREREARGDEGQASRLGVHPSEMKKGVGVVQTAPGGRGFWEEGVAARRMDNPGNTACAWCGSPNELKACARCKQRFYCGRECQKAHWSSGHKAECGKK